jgi:predicted SPOUT superfamily RNA methylase MTH1
MIKEVLEPLIENCFSKVLHIRHGAIFGVSEIIIGLSGKSKENREEILEKVLYSMSVNERKTIKESEN